MTSLHPLQKRISSITIARVATRTEKVEGGGTGEVVAGYFVKASEKDQAWAKRLVKLRKLQPTKLSLVQVRPTSLQDFYAQA